jgi:microcystin-dependent protein
MPNLATLELYAAELPPRTVTLSGMSVTVILTSLDAANRIYDWWYDNEQLTDEQITYMYEILGTARKELLVSQIGEVKMFATGTDPAGCLLCDGATYERTAYPELYSLLSTSFIIDADHFVVPDMRGNFVYGAAATMEIGETGGEAAVVLSEGEIPSHAHTIPTTVTTLALEPGEVAVLSPVPIIPSYTGNTGGDGSHNNIPPYLKLAFYIQAL